MDPMERLIVERNGWRYIDEMAHEPSKIERGEIAGRLLKEEDKFGKEAERLDAIDGWVNKLDGYVTKQNVLVAAYHDAGVSAGQGERTLILLKEMRLTLLALRATFQDRLNLAVQTL